MSWISKIREFFSSDTTTDATTDATADTEEVPEENDQQDLDSMKLAELRAVAKSRGIKGISGLRKAQLLEHLKNN